LPIADRFSPPEARHVLEQRQVYNIGPTLRRNQREERAPGATDNRQYVKGESPEQQKSSQLVSPSHALAGVIL
jgi:hypothetical protein